MCADEVCTITAPAITGSNTVLLLAVGANAYDQPPISATYDGVDLGAPFATDYTRTFVWVVTNPGSAKSFTVEWDNGSLGRLHTLQANEIASRLVQLGAWLARFEQL